MNIFICTYSNIYIYIYMHTYIHYIILHCIALHYITLHYITLCITLCTTLHTYVYVYIYMYRQYILYLSCARLHSIIIHLPFKAATKKRNQPGMLPQTQHPAKSSLSEVRPTGQGIGRGGLLITELGAAVGGIELTHPPRWIAHDVKKASDFGHPPGCGW